MFAELNKTVGDTMVLSDEAQKSIDDSVDAGVQEINYTQYKEQVWTFKINLSSFKRICIPVYLDDIRK